MDIISGQFDIPSFTDGQDEEIPISGKIIYGEGIETSSCVPEIGILSYDWLRQYLLHVAPIALLPTAVFSYDLTCLFRQSSHYFPQFCDFCNFVNFAL